MQLIKETEVDKLPIQREKEIFSNEKLFFLTKKIRY